MQSRLFTWTLLGATVLAGCGHDPRAATKENFQRAMDAKLMTIRSYASTMEAFRLVQQAFRIKCTLSRSP